MMPDNTPTDPWHVSRAIWDPETEEVAYILDNAYLANAIDARLMNAARDLLAAAEAIRGDIIAHDYRVMPSRALQLQAAINKATTGEQIIEVE